MLLLEWFQVLYFLEINGFITTFIINGIIMIQTENVIITGWVLLASENNLWDVGNLSLKKIQEVQRLLGRKCDSRSQDTPLGEPSLQNRGRMEP